MKRSHLALLALAAAGCGGIVNYQKDDVDSGGSSGDGGSPTGPGSGGSSGTSTIKPDILAVQLIAGCMPAIPADPVTGSVTVEYDNSGTAPGSMNITSAQIAFATGTEAFVFPLNFNPTTSGTIDPGTTHATQHEKVATAGDASSVCNLCGQQGTLDLRFLDDQGAESQASSAFTLSCAF